MISLIQTRFSLVSNVDTRVNVVVHHAAVEGDGPLWRVEPHDSNGGAILHLELVARLCETQRILVVLVPGPHEFDVVAFNEHRGSVLAAPHSIHEHLRHGEGDLGAGAALAHLNWQLSVNISGPVEALALFGVDEALVTIGRHHHDTIVCHYFLLNYL